MTTEQQSEEEQRIKLEQALEYFKNQPSLIAKLLGSLKKGKKEKPSVKKSDSSRINAQKARDARKAKAELDSKNESTESD